MAVIEAALAYLFSNYGEAIVVLAILIGFMWQQMKQNRTASREGHAELKAQLDTLTSDSVVLKTDVAVLKNDVRGIKKRVNRQSGKVEDVEKAIIGLESSHGDQNKVPDK